MRALNEGKIAPRASSMPTRRCACARTTSCSTCAAACRSCAFRTARTPVARLLELPRAHLQVQGRREPPPACSRSCRASSAACATARCPFPSPSAPAATTRRGRTRRGRRNELARPPWRARRSLAALAAPSSLSAEYADVLINKRSDAAGVRPVVFPHWFHRIRFQCRVSTTSSASRCAPARTTCSWPISRTGSSAACATTTRSPGARSAAICAIRASPGFRAASTAATRLRGRGGGNAPAPRSCCYW